MAAGLRSLFFSVHNLAQCLLLTKNTSLEKWVLASQHLPIVRKNIGSRDEKFLPLSPQLLLLVWDLESQAVGPGLR